MRARLGVIGSVTTLLLLVGIPAWACGFLIAPNGAVRLGRTTTLAAYADGVEHYVTSFEFQGGGAAFGSIVPLPGVPDTIERAGSWTLQRLLREVVPPAPEAAPLPAAASRAAIVLEEVEVDALDITILEGGGQAVFDWAREQGFDLGEGAAEMLEFYAARSPYFMAARFDVERAAQLEQTNGDGTPIHLAIPTDNPWVPLRILGFDKPAEEVVQADVFLLTPQRPTLLPAPTDTFALEHSAPATRLLLDDLRSDENSSWVPKAGWLTYLRLAEPAGDLTYDLAIDVRGDAPDPVDAGLVPGPNALGPEFDDVAAGAGADGAQILGLAMLILIGAGVVFTATGVVGPGTRRR